MKKGFTLIELLVVIGIIGLLASFLMPTFLGVQNKAKEGAVKSVMHQAQLAVETYNMENGTYPIDVNITLKTLFENYLKAGEYMAEIPKNPFTNKQYTENDSAGKIVYTYDSNKNTYIITGYKRNGSSKVLELTNM